MDCYRHSSSHGLWTRLWCMRPRKPWVQREGSSERWRYHSSPSVEGMKRLKTSRRSALSLRRSSVFPYLPPRKALEYAVGTKGTTTSSLEESCVCLLGCTAARIEGQRFAAWRAMRRSINSRLLRWIPSWKTFNSPYVRIIDELLKPLPLIPKGSAY